jgi:hypothetical protein
MTTNAYIFSWDQEGIEAIIPITTYEHWDHNNLLSMIAGKPIEPNPLNTIVRNLLLRAKFNSQRHYEIYAIDCDDGLDEQFWREQWETCPQETANIVRERGHKLYSDRANSKRVKIT